MGLHAISQENKTLSHHCNNPDCRFHNCANWEEYQTCTHHDRVEYVVIPASEMQARLRGAVPDEHLKGIGDTILSQPSTSGRKEGETRTIPLDHEGIQYTGPGVVALPLCECGTQLFLKVHFTEQELQSPNIQMVIRDNADPTVIKEIRQHPMVARHQQLHEHLQSIGRVYAPPAPPSL